MDALTDLTDPALQRSLPIVLAAIAAVGAAMFLGVLWSRRRPMQARTRLFRQRLGVVGLFFVVAAGVAYALLAMPAEPDPSARAGAAPSAALPESEAGVEIVSARRFSSAKLPALSLDAPEGWRLELDEKRRKLTAGSDAAHLLVSTAVLTEAVDVEAFLAQLAETQRTLGFDVGATFSERIGDLPAAGFLATGPTRSVCTWMVKRDTHLATSLICTADGKKTAREACRGPLASVRWRTPARGGH